MLLAISKMSGKVKVLGSSESHYSGMKAELARPVYARFT